MGRQQHGPQAGRFDSHHSQGSWEWIDNTTVIEPMFLFSGLVSKVLPADQIEQEAIKTGEKIAGMSHLISIMAKECVNKGA